MSSPTHRNLELEAAIEKEPDNLDAYLVYADWLQARGDPRGELIALHCAAHQASAEEAPRFQALATALLDTHEDTLLGGLVGVKHKVTWRLGFIDELTLAGKMTTRSGRELTQDEFLRLFMALPTARFVRGIQVKMAIKGFPLSRQFLDALDSASYPSVERLTFGQLKEFRDTPGHRLWSLGHLQLSNRSLPRLRSLTLCGNMDPLDGLDLPELRELRILSATAIDHLAECLSTARLTGLERLVIERHTESLDLVLDGREILPLLELEGLPHLKHLGLKGIVDSTAAWGGRLCQTLIRSHRLRRLESLDLSDGEMTDAVARVLVDHAAAFVHLRHLDVSNNHLSAECVARVSRLCASVAASRQRV